MFTRRFGFAGTLSLCVTAGLVATFSASIAHADGPLQRPLMLSVDRDIEQSGLLSFMIPVFTAQTSIPVRIVAVKSAEAVLLARRGESDIVISSDLDDMTGFMTSGYGVDRRPLMSMDYVLIGPSSDPAKIAGDKSVVDALTKIAQTRSPFVSPLKDEAENSIEHILWLHAGVDAAQQSWYASFDRRDLLKRAVEHDAYALVDRASWAGFQSRQDLVAQVEGDPALVQQFDLGLANQARHHGVEADAAAKLADWLTSTYGQQMISNYLLGDVAVFKADFKPPAPPAPIAAAPVVAAPVPVVMWYSTGNAAHPTSAKIP